MRNLLELKKDNEFMNELKNISKNKDFLREYENYKNSKSLSKWNINIAEYYYLKRNNKLKEYEDFFTYCLRENKKEFIDNAFIMYLRLQTKDKVIPAYRKNFISEIFETEKSSKVKYFCNLDKIDKIFKGFQTGLYVLGAETGTGKTSLMLQIADAFAKNKNHVIYCSLEMSQKELISKSLARISREQNKTINFTSFEILNNELDLDAKEVIDKSKKFYCNNIEPYLYFSNISTALELRELIEEYINTIKLDQLFLLIIYK